MRKTITLAVLALAISAPAMPVKEALGQIESGATKPERCSADLASGPLGEVSRYQIQLSVWREYGGGDPTNPTNAWAVASAVLRDRTAAFKRAVDREPTPRELYALWNAPGQFAERGYDWQRLSRAVRKRSQRFANLVEEVVQIDPGRERPAFKPLASHGIL